MLFRVFAVQCREPRNSSIFTTIRPRRERNFGTKVEATAQNEDFKLLVEATPVIDSASRVLPLRENKNLETEKKMGDKGKRSAEDVADDIAVGISFNSRAQYPVVGEISEAAPKQRGCLPDGSCAAKDAAVNSQPSEPRPDRDSIPREGSTTPTELPRTEGDFDSPPTGTCRGGCSNVGNQSCGKPRGRPGFSRLKAPGWGNDTAINTIPPAFINSTPPASINSIPPAYSSVGSVVSVGEVGIVGGVGGVGGAGPVKTNTSLAAAPPGAKGPISATFLPRDLLTPVTEVATVDEHSMVTCSTRRTARNTPASSVASGEPKQKHAASGARFSGRLRSTGPKSKHSGLDEAMRGRFRSPSPSGGHDRVKGGNDEGNQLESPAEPSDGRRKCRQGGERQRRGDNGANRLESPAIPSGGRRRRREGGEKREGWGTGSVGSAQSAPGGGIQSSPGYCELASGGGRSISSPLCNAVDGRFTSLSNGHQSPLGGRLTSFSCGRRSRRGREEHARGGYVAAMSRRKRSVARCEAAVTLVTSKARPSTPISERARWGKGRESQAEVERRKLLRRRSEYADELKRKAKVRRAIDQDYTAPGTLIWY